MKTKPKKYKAIIFDLGGVLSLGKKINEMKGVHEEVAKKLGFSVDEYFDSIDSTYADAIEGKITRSKAIRTMSKNLKTTEKNLIKVYRKAYKKNFRRNMPLYRFALKLKKAGYKIGIISDIWYVAKEIFFYDDYYKHFGCVLASCDVGSRKSGKKIFRVALKKLNLKTNQVVFTDNEKWNLYAPRSMGIKSILFKNNSQFINKLKRLSIQP